MRFTFEEWEDARVKFKLGQRVRLSDEARDNGITVGRAKKDHATGVVVGFGKQSKYLVRVLPVGNLHPSTYHTSFWEPIT